MLLGAVLQGGVLRKERVKAALELLVLQLRMACVLLLRRWTHGQCCRNSHALRRMW